MDTKLVFFKNAFNIFVCQSYSGVRFVSFTLLPEFSTFGFQDLSRYLELFVLEDVCLRVVVIQESLDTSREGGRGVRFVFWVVLFFSSDIKNCTADCPAPLGGFPRPFVFRHTHLEISEIRSYRKLFSFTVFACCWLVINFLISWFESSDFLSVASLWVGNCSISASDSSPG